MNEREMLIDSARALFADVTDLSLEDAWSLISGQGLPFALLPEASGGFGFAALDALALIRLAGQFLLGTPLPETMVANATLDRAGLASAVGMAAIIPFDSFDASGKAARVAFGRSVSTLVVETVLPSGERGVARLTHGWQVAGESTNIAGSPRDTLALDLDALAACAVPLPGLDLKSQGAAVRAIQIAGALDRLLPMTVDYSNTREQFGRPLSKFQAIQHELARLAGEVAAAGAAADMAADAVAGSSPTARWMIAAARVRTGEAAGTAAAIAHQLHGAIGVTAEHDLHKYTTAVWAWRDEFGGNPFWAQVLGDAAIVDEADRFWHLVTSL